MFAREIQQVKVVQESTIKEKGLETNPLEGIYFGLMEGKDRSLHKQMQRRTKSTEFMGTKDFGEAALAPKLADGGSMRLKKLAQINTTKGRGRVEPPKSIAFHYILLLLVIVARCCCFLLFDYLDTQLSFANLHPTPAC